MSNPPIMVPCPRCGESGKIIRYMPLNQTQKYFRIEDICDKCGGRGRIAL